MEQTEKLIEMGLRPELLSQAQLQSFIKHAENAKRGEDEKINAYILWAEKQLKKPKSCLGELKKEAEAQMRLAIEFTESLSRENGGFAFSAAMSDKQIEELLDMFFDCVQRLAGCKERLCCLAAKCADVNADSSLLADIRLMCAAVNECSSSQKLKGSCEALLALAETLSVEAIKESCGLLGSNALEFAQKLSEFCLLGNETVKRAKSSRSRHELDVQIAKYQMIFHDIGEKLKNGE